jgi:MFS family permease
MASYTDVLRTPGVIRIVGSQLLARFPFGMMTLVFVIHIQGISGSYALAGLAVGLETLGVAISGPLLGRFMVHFGVRRMLIVAASITSMAMLTIGLAPIPVEAMVALCLVVGLSSPPVQSAVRTIYPSLVAKRSMGTLYALDASLQEIIWVVGPVAATLLAASGSSSLGVVVMAVVQIGGAVWFASNPEISQIDLPKPSRRLGGVLRQKIVRANVVIGGLLVGSFSGVEVGTVALFDRGTAGLVIASLSIGSLLGGFALGHRARTKYALTRYLFFVALGCILVYFAPTNPYWLATTWFIAGLCVAPALGLLGAIIGASVKSQDAPEAYGWVGTGQTAGYAIAAAATGFIIDAFDPTIALGVAGVCASLATLVAWYSARFTPVISNQHTEEN